MANTSMRMTEVRRINKSLHQGQASTRTSRYHLLARPPRYVNLIGSRCARSKSSRSSWHSKTNTSQQTSGSAEENGGRPSLYHTKQQSVAQLCIAQNGRAFYDNTHE
uniref:Uncharacterized protein n=1 Tax=Spironucleus salmonicida TaxID=348837 RepID=V6M6L9_9EUKA|eukprot:EST49059.1 Hypothetical protein SS50377_10682 [Spironucleus salmonicida]